MAHATSSQTRSLRSGAPRGAAGTTAPRDGTTAPRDGTMVPRDGTTAPRNGTTALLNGRPGRAPGPPPGLRAPASANGSQPGAAPERLEGRRKREAFEAEALPHLDALHGLALRLSGGREAWASDLVQEAVLRAYQAWHTFQPGTNCRAWLMTILRNCFINDRRRASARGTHLEFREELGWEGSDGFPGRAPETPAELFFDGTLDDEVVRAIDALPEKYRTAVVLSDLMGLTYQEAAEDLHVPVGTVKSRLFRGRRALRDRLYDYAVEMGYIEGRSRPACPSLQME